MLASIPLASLHVDRSVSLRKSDCLPTIRRYARCLQAGDHFPSMDVCVDEQGEYWLADGFLRYDAHTLLGTEEVTVRVHAGGARGARAFACGANDLHGLRRTVAEKRAAVERMLADPEWKTWSDHLIADSCRVSHTFVARMRGRREAGSTENGGKENGGKENGASELRKGRDGRPVKRRQVAESRSLLPEGTWSQQSSPTAEGTEERVPDPSGQQGPSEQQGPFRQKGPTKWVRATPTAPGLCELPRLPASRDLPPVNPEQAKAAVDPLAHARDLLLAARGRLIEGQALAPDPHCPHAADGIDHALANLLAWLERIDPNFEEEGRPPQLPRVVEAAACLHAERANLRSALGAWLPAADASRPQPNPPRTAPVAPAAAASIAGPGRNEPPAAPPGGSRLKSMRPEAAVSAPPRRGPPAPVGGGRATQPAQSPPLWPIWMTAAMTEATSACLAGDEDGMRQVMARQQAAFAEGRAESLATLPVIGRRPPTGARE